LKPALNSAGKTSWDAGLRITQASGAGLFQAAFGDSGRWSSRRIVLSGQCAVSRAQRPDQSLRGSVSLYRLCLPYAAGRCLMVQTGRGPFRLLRYSPHLVRLNFRLEVACLHPS